MVDLIRQQIILQGKVEPIERFEVWFATPYGLHETLPQAMEAMEKFGFPLEAIRATPVAISKTTYECL